jgi:signal transduction histidine kinase
MPRKSFYSLRNKLLFFIFLLVLLLQAISFINQYNQTSSYLLGNMVDRAYTVSADFTFALNKRVSSFDNFEQKNGYVDVFVLSEGKIILKATLDKFTNLDEVDFIDSSGNILLTETNSVFPRELLGLSSDDLFSFVLREDVYFFEKDRYFVVSVPVLIENKKVGFLVFYYTNEELIIREKNLIKTDLLFLVLFLFFGFVAAVFISNNVTSPITSLRESVEQIEKGNFKVRTNIKSDDEFGVLGIAFNKMAEQLQEAHEDLEKKVRERTRELYYTQLDLERRTRQANQAKIATLNILEDIEESKGKLDEAYHQLKALEKLKNNFLSFTTHELKTPLTPILIQAQMLQEGDFGKLTAEQKKSIDLIVRNMRTLNQLIGDVLDISVIQSKNLKIFPIRANVADIIRQVVSNNESLAKQKNISISVKLPQLHSLLIDVKRIGQVVNNLLNNAIKFTPEGGSITIEAQENSDKVLVKVIDTGIGISKDKINTLFQPFSQVVASYTLKQKGTGLGLAICKGIIEAHDGKIGVQSEPGKGSVFYFSLPRKSHFGGNKR